MGWIHIDTNTVSASGTQTKIYDNATDSFTITSNNNIFASTNFTERQ